MECRPPSLHRCGISEIDSLYDRFHLDHRPALRKKQTFGFAAPYGCAMTKTSSTQARRLSSPRHSPPRMISSHASELPVHIRGLRHHRRGPCRRSGNPAHRRNGDDVPPHDLSSTISLLTILDDIRRIDPRSTIRLDDPPDYGCPPLICGSVLLGRSASPYLAISSSVALWIAGGPGQSNRQCG